MTACVDRLLLSVLLAGMLQLPGLVDALERACFLLARGGGGGETAADVQALDKVEIVSPAPRNPAVSGSGQA